MWDNAQTIELWIKNLGRSHSDLVKLGIIPALPLKRLYRDSLSLEVLPCPGIELSFWFETQRFEAIYITLISQDPTKAPAYAGSLPAPFGTLNTQEQVHKVLGLPYKSNGPMSHPDSPNFNMGGWDFYELDEQSSENCLVEFQYNESLAITLLSFSVFDREG